MRIAVTYEDGKIFQHFGHTERFKVYDVEDGEIRMTSVVNTMGSGRGALADILKKGSVDVLICGGVGDGAKRALAEAGITLYGGIQGDADTAVGELLAGRLAEDPNAVCSHRGEHRQGEGHGPGDSDSSGQGGSSGL